MIAPPDGTRYSLPEQQTQLRWITERLQRLYQSWGYQPVEVPALERYDPLHPAAHKSFKLSDRDGEVLALRADFTPALARLIKASFPDQRPRRLQYTGKLWQAHADMARAREFTQVGLELVGVSNHRADAELIHLARESVREVGLAPRVEIGNPGVVRALFNLANVPEGERESLADAIHRKDQRTMLDLLEARPLAADLRRALLLVPDLYGDVQVLTAGRQAMPWPETVVELDRLEAVLSEFEDDSELLLDLGMARRLNYYTGVMFNAYTFDFGQPILGGGRYDGALLPYAAGFALGLERLLSALNGRGPGLRPPLLLSLDDAAARYFRAQGYAVERALYADLEAAREYARWRGSAYLLSPDGLVPIVADPPEQEALSALYQAYREGRHD
ncbi:MAG: ATP phosphoribosyltransferase regulatory subunit [Truepera sp.]|nr:ATP phosphoribosyltransferase regulatory subunit [Truepera sp.]